MAFSSHLTSRQLRLFLLTGFIALLCLTSCTSLNATGNQSQNSISTPDGIDLTVSACRTSPCAMPTLATTTTPGSTPGIRPFIDTWNNIHLFQSFDYHIHDPASIARYYDFIWGASIDKVQAYRANNPNIFLSYYISFFRDSGTFRDLSAHQDLVYWKSVHPDWILYQCDRITPAYEDNQTNIVPFDFSNPGLVSWQVQTYAQQASESGYDAIAADNVNIENLIHACGSYKNGQWVQRYSGESIDPQWRADVITWLTRMQQALHSLKHPLALIPNLGLGGIPLGDPEMQQVVAHVDGVLDEAGFTRYGGGGNPENAYLTDSLWEQTIWFIESAQQQHKPYYLINEIPAGSPGQISSAQIQWVLASYLMCKEHTAGVSISPIQAYGADTRYNEYNIQIGTPLVPMYYAQNVYWRDYSGGLVVVNASASSAYTVTTSGSMYVDLDGNHVAKTFTIPPHSGMILLNG